MGWEGQSRALEGELKVREGMDHIETLRQQVTREEEEFDQELENIILAGKRALLRMRMQVAAEMPGVKYHLFRQIKRQIKRCLALRRDREIARGITREQSRRMRRRRRLELQIQYETAYGAEQPKPKSRKWLRHMGRIV